MALERTETHFSGHVQGVGFRYITHEIAQRHAVVGHVRNLIDGRVLLVAEGEAAELERFLEAIAERMGGYIRETKSLRGEPTGEFNGFDIRH